MAITIVETQKMKKIAQVRFARNLLVQVVNASSIGGCVMGITIVGTRRMNKIAQIQLATDFVFEVVNASKIRGSVMVMTTAGTMGMNKLAENRLPHLAMELLVQMVNALSARMFVTETTIVWTTPMKRTAGMNVKNTNVPVENASSTAGSVMAIDCRDNHDEDCPTALPYCTEYRCLNGGRCINYSQVCDGVNDCRHNDDEFACNVK
jgi:hypothetical protein